MMPEIAQAADDAVHGEAVSAGKFPFIRENNREFCEWYGVKICERAVLSAAPS